MGRRAAAPRGRLFRKYVALLVGLVGLVLLVNAALDFWFSFTENKAALFQIQEEKARSAAHRIEEFVGEIERQIGWTTPPQWAASPIEQRRFDYVRLLRQVPAITELIQLDGQGRAQLEVSRLAMDVIGSGKDYSHATSFIEARAHRVWYGPVYFRKQSEPYMTIAVAGSGHDAGVTIADVNLKLIWDVITALKIGQGGYAYVVDSRGRLIADPDISLVLRDTDLSKLPQVAAARGEAAADTAAPTAAVARNLDGQEVLSAHAAIPLLGWLVFVEVPVREALAPIYATAWRTAALLLLGLVLATLAALFLARRMVVPIRAIEEGAARIGAGELDRRIDIRTGDELEALAGRFNRMAADLQQSYAGLERKVEERTAELTEALEQQTATSEVLGVINSSPGDLVPVFDAMLERAMRLCEASYSALMTYDGERMHAVAQHGLPPALADFVGKPFDVPATSMSGRLVAGAAMAHVVDLAADPGYSDPTNAVRRGLVDLGGAKTGLAVAMRKDGALLGALWFYRTELRPFTDKQMALLQNFAAQAVIAMENARLLGELRQRTHDLEESLEYQTSTGEVLKVISRSVFDLDTVLQAVAATALRLCRAESVVVYRNDGGVYRWAAGQALVPEYEERERAVAIQPGMGTVVGRAALDGRAVHILDAWIDPRYEAKEDARVGGVHTMVGVPLLREGLPIGVIGLARRRVEAFTEREVALVTTFADQAVIAIENARLFNELRERTRDLEEALEYQTATSDVLKVISRAAFDLQPVLEFVLETAMRLCGNSQGEIFRLEGEVYRMAVSYGLEPAYREIEKRAEIRPGNDTLVGRTALARQPVHIADALADPEYGPKGEARINDIRTMLGVPLLRDGAVIGVICLARRSVEPYTEKQVALLSTFADQAVIAIENARLFSELRDRTAELGRSVDELRLLGEIGRAVSSTLDLRAVLSTVLTRSVAVTGVDAGAIYRFNRRDRAYRLAEAVGWDAALRRAVGDLGIDEGETAMGEAAAARTPLQLADLATLPSTPLRDASLAAGLRSVLIVPLVGPERILGALVLQRRAAGAFAPETVRLMQTLASQSVLAIQNARLFREIAEKSEELELASQHKSQFLANMSHELRTPLNAILGYAELLVDGIYGALPEKAQAVLERVQNNGKHLLALINDVLDLSKIEAGQLTLSLEDYSMPELVRSVVGATEPLAAAKGLQFTAVVDDAMPTAHGDARRVSQVLLNLVGNAIKFTDAGAVEIRAAAADGHFDISVRDTGPGIAAADQERIFGEFQQIDNSNTRNKGGTGLGLAISKRMVEIQGGTISVDSAAGRGSTFRIVLPVQVEAMEETEAA